MPTSVSPRQNDVKTHPTRANHPNPKSATPQKKPAMSNTSCSLDDPALLKKWAFGETLQRYRIGDMLVEEVKEGHTYLLERTQKGSTLLMLREIRTNKISAESLSAKTGGAAGSAPNGTQNAVSHN